MSENDYGFSVAKATEIFKRRIEDLEVFNIGESEIDKIHNSESRMLARVRKGTYELNFRLYEAFKGEGKMH